MKRNLHFDDTSHLYLGVGSNHDFAGCLIEDGEIRLAIEAERLSKIKHSLDVFNPFHSVLKYIFDQSDPVIHSLSSCDTLDLRNLVEYKSQIRLYNHHLCHASATFFTSPYEDAAILVTDGVGSRTQLQDGTYKFETVSLYSGHGTRIQEVKKIFGFASEDFDERHNHKLDVPNSLGIFYTYITKIVGFNFLEDGKTMGLSSFGNPDVYYNELKKLISINHADETIMISLTDEIASVYMARFSSKQPESSFQSRADFAAAGQKILEEIYIYYLNSLYRTTGQKNLCLSGGVVLNSLANGKILDGTPFEKIHIFPACGDSAIAAGSALLSFYEDRPESRVIIGAQSPFLGKEYSEEEISSTLTGKTGFSFVFVEDKYAEAAKLLSQGEILAWFQGKSEFGPRALGHRSIIASPVGSDTKKYINEVIKKREFFRPFAPAVLYNCQKEYFDSEVFSPYMLLVLKTKESRISDIPAVVHVDGTARVQSVNEDNPDFFSLLQSMQELTGIPIILNTSFNLNGRPIVETIDDAINTFLESELKFMFLGNYLCKK